MTSDVYLLSVCIPTVDRPDELRRTLASLGAQTRPPDSIVVVDASRTGDTRIVCEEFASQLPAGVLAYEPSARSLPLQRRRGIDVIRRNTSVRYICFLDDDVVLAEDFLSTIVGFLESEAGRDFGGISGYDLTNWGQPFFRSERLYHRVGLFEGELRPGRWLYNGYFLDLYHLSCTAELHECDFLSGPFIVWRSEVFDRFLPPIAMKGYALGEDKHFSLRVRSRYRLAVHCGAKAWHLQAVGGRPGSFRSAYDYVRMHALLLRDCDPSPSIGRYLAFLAFHLINTLVFFAVFMAGLRLRELAQPAGWAVGWLSTVIRPPRRTVDALEPGAGRRHL